MKRLHLWIGLVTALVVSMGLAGSPWAKTPPDIAALERRAVQGDAQAMCRLARAYYHGRGVLKDPVQARCWVARAHDAGYAEAEKLWNRWSLWQYTGECSALPQPVSLPQDGDRFYEPFTGMNFVWVPGGCFSMGCFEGAQGCDRDEFPAHKVCLDGFWMGETEVTQGQWEALTGRNPARFRYGSDFPVEQVSYEAVEGLIRLLNTKTGLKFSLPTEAQWEYAARGGGEKIGYPWGDETYMPPANCGTCDALEHRGRTAPVKQFAPNDLGLYDMGGNVAEWCRDYYHPSAYAKHRKNNPRVKQGRERVVRGGRWADNARELRTTQRDQMMPRMADSGVGFRLVLKRRPWSN